MPAVSDAGPLIHLAQVGRLDLLIRIFGKVTVVRSVKYEVVDVGIRLGYPDAPLIKDALAMGRIVVQSSSSLLTKRAAKLAKQEKLSLSDSETLLLAKMLAQPLLTDEKPLSMLGRMYGLQVWNTWTILLEGLRVGLVTKLDVQAAVKELGEMRHKLSPQRAKEVLEAADRIVSGDFWSQHGL